MQLESEAEPGSRPASYGLMRGVAAVVMASAFVVWALVWAAKVPCRCDASLTVRGAAMPWLSAGVVLMSVATVLLVHAEAPGVLPKAAVVVGWVGVVSAYGAFLAQRFGYEGQLVLAAVSALVFTTGVSAMIWKGASRRMAVSFGVVLGFSVVVVAALILGRGSS